MHPKVTNDLAIVDTLTENKETTSRVYYSVMRDLQYT
jgi:hypothetical protein